MEPEILHKKRTSGEIIIYEARLTKLFHEEQEITNSRLTKSVNNGKSTDQDTSQNKGLRSKSRQMSMKNRDKDKTQSDDNSYKSSKVFVNIDNVIPRVSSGIVFKYGSVSPKKFDDGGFFGKRDSDMNILQLKTCQDIPDYDKVNFLPSNKKKFPNIQLKNRSQSNPKVQKKLPKLALLTSCIKKKQVDSGLMMINSYTKEDIQPQNIPLVDLKTIFHKAYSNKEEDKEQKSPLKKGTVLDQRSNGLIDRPDQKKIKFQIGNIEKLPFPKRDNPDLTANKKHKAKKKKFISLKDFPQEPTDSRTKNDIATSMHELEPELDKIFKEKSKKLIMNKMINLDKNCINKSQSPQKIQTDTDSKRPPVGGCERSRLLLNAVYDQNNPKSCSSQRQGDILIKTESGQRARIRSISKSNQRQNRE